MVGRAWAQDTGLGGIVVDDCIPDPDVGDGYSDAAKVLAGGLGAAATVGATILGGIATGMGVAAGIAVWTDGTKVSAGGLAVQSLIFGVLASAIGTLAWTGGEIYDDPPRSDYARPVTITWLDLSTQPWAAYIPAGLRPHLTAIVDHISLLAGYLDAIEMAQGAELAGDDAWASTHRDKALAIDAALAGNVPALRAAVVFIGHALDEGDDDGVMTAPSDERRERLDQVGETISAWCQPLFEAGGRSYRHVIDASGVPAGTTLPQARAQLQTACAQLVAVLDGGTTATELFVCVEHEVEVHE